MPSPVDRIFPEVDSKRPDEIWRDKSFCNGSHGRAMLDICASEERRRTKNLGRFVFVTFLSVIILFWRFSAWHASTIFEEHERNRSDVNSGINIFDWTAHPPSKALNWTECYNGFQCARITVPLVYSEPSGEEAAIALIKSPSKYPPGHERYRGPVLFNPGGPGDSGVKLILHFESSFRKFLSDEFDLVGFDPRGVGFTTPSMSVFDNQVDGGKFYVQFPINMNTSESTLGEAYARAGVLGKLVEDRARFVAERVSTPSVARDMLRIVQAFGENKLQYWGLSYGTILGATFAAMFPNNVGRIVLDGVVDTEDYYKGLWANNLRDADAALTTIYHACMTAGPSNCPIYENSTSLIQARVDRLMDRLKLEPLTYYDKLGANYEIVDYGLARNIIFTALYNTHGSGARLTRALAAVERGDPAELYMMSIKRLFNALVQCSCPAPGEIPPRFGGAYEITYAIQCGDAVDRNENLDSLREAYEGMARMSSFAATWPSRVFCSAWKLRAKERFSGPFEQTTGHPLLLIGNTADPVTPLWNAHKVSRGFKDSVVLTQNSAGHCSLSATSLCTTKAIRDYFINGTLPRNGTVCETQSSIFGEKEFRLDTLTVEERELVEASDMIRRNYFIQSGS